ncbi:MAG: hypothetical protein A3C14_00845 [Candidatus Lloydbacteria bacterium RIFCSPHIGHO2_02_FULL_50_18]|nr:MAG: hypothetical protein A3C14_00845 [Candidatus Lloydbacteria bacterium RIFCSPHIGHO2_02_FULL_50_18]
MLFAVVALALILAIVRWRIYRQELAQKAAIIESVLSYIYKQVSATSAEKILRQQNETLTHTTLIGRKFFCDCMWPHPPTTERDNDDGARILRTLDGYLDITEHAELEGRLALFGVRKERGSALLFLIEADGCKDASVRMRHGIFYKLEIKNASGTTTLVASGILPLPAPPKSSNDKLLEEIFAVLESSSNGRI